MSRKKRTKQDILERTNKRRKQEDALLITGFVSTSEKENKMVKTKPLGSWEDQEQNYELLPRKLKGDDTDLVEGLPIKVNGIVERNQIKTRRIEQANRDAKVESDEDAGSSDSSKHAMEESDLEDEPDTEAKIVALKEEIAELVEKLMEEPEEHISALTRLCKMVTSKNPNTCKFAMLALVPVFTSLIPGYRIRPLTEIEKREKVSRDIARLRNFEQNLVSNYKVYIDHLKVLAKVPNNDEEIKFSLGVLSMRALIELIPSASRFNYRAEVFTILIRRICKPSLKSDPIAKDVIRALESLINDDDEGNLSLDIVRILSKTMKTRNYNVEESVLNIFLSLDVLHDYNGNSDDAERPPKSHVVDKKNRVHFSKKQKKARKELKQIEKEMQQAEQTVTAEERQTNQGKILELVLSIYLNILRSGSKNLTGAVLEGLAKFGKMTNYEMLGDFLVVMKELIRNILVEEVQSSEVRKALLCIVSAFSLVSHHSHMKIGVDLSSFVDALYAILPDVALDPDIELSYKSMRLADPLNAEILKPSVNVSTKAELLIKAVDHVFFRSRSGSKERASAFTKRLYMCSLHTPERTTCAILKFIDKLMSKYTEIAGLYSTEDRIANGNFNLESNELHRSNPGAATLWENKILSKHYCPTVVTGINALAKKSAKNAL